MIKDQKHRAVTVAEAEDEYFAAIQYHDGVDSEVEPPHPPGEEFSVGEGAPDNHASNNFKSLKDSFKRQRMQSISRARGRLSDKDIPNLRKRWMEECERSLASQPDRLPPLRKINHRIPLIDENKRFNY